MSLPKIKPFDFEDWNSYYFNYQKLLASSYYIPLLKSQNIEVVSESKILDIGCGDGGFISAFSEKSDVCHGVEIRDFKWDEKLNTNFFVGDITSQKIKNHLNPKYDIIILRDVIEHILLKNKLDFLNAVCSYMNFNSRLLLTFPPFYSPFGLHQQAILKSILRFIPFLGWLPKTIIKFLLSITNQLDKWVDIEEIKDCRMTIQNFRKLVAICGLEICYHERYFFRPSHEIRYDVKMRKLNWLNIPVLEEIFVSGCTFILKMK